MKNNLHLIPLEQNIQGFQLFIAAWLYKGEKTVLVDPGPVSTIPVLINRLEALDIVRPDMILLTHIHIDHAGGVADLLTRYPDTPVVCHAAGLRHLPAPEKLWKGSLKTLGDTARAYGPIGPVPAGLLLDADSFNDFGIRCILTPGHAAHHVSYLYEGILFGGEAAGIHVGLADGGVYLRPATPPRFFLEEYAGSLEKLIDTPHDLFCYGHFGVTENTPDLLKQHREQLDLWADIIGREMHTGSGPELEAHLISVLLENDPLMRLWHHLTLDVQARERTFLTNSIRGYLGYLEQQDRGIADS